jgi:segregation and condensation protein B
MSPRDINLKRVLEAILFVAAEPISASRLEELTAGTRGAGERVQDALAELEREYEAEERSFTIRKVAEGYQMRTREIYASWIRKLYRTRRTVYLSKPALETLAIIAYKQPVTRSEIEAIRGVAVDGLLKTLLDRELIKISGQKEVVGRPYLYRTCRKFLEHFGLASLSELPPLEAREKPSVKKITSAAELKPPAAGDEVAEPEETR